MPPGSRTAARDYSEEFPMRLVILLAGTLCLCRFSAVAQTVTEPIPEANPARPTVSTPATLTPVGYLQFETGSLGAVTSPEFSVRIGINQVTKLTVAPRLEFFVQTEPFIHSSDGDGRNKQIHPGEVFVCAQALVSPGDGIKPTISVAYVRRLYESPAPELDLGTFRESGTILLSNDMARLHFDANFIVAEQTESGTRRAQLAQTLSVSRRIRKFTLSGEIWHFTQPYLVSNATGNLWALAYPLRRNLVIDGGFDHGFTRTSTHWEEFIGFTYLLPDRLWSGKGAHR
jgi:hypothetical protein